MAIFDKIVQFAQRNAKKNSVEGDKKKKKRKQEQEQNNQPQQDNSVAGTASRIINKVVNNNSNSSNNNDNQNPQTSYRNARAEQIKKVNAQLQNAKKEKQEQEERKQQVNQGVSAKTQRQRDEDYQKIKDAADQLQKQRSENADNRESTTSNGGTLSQSTSAQKKPYKFNQDNDPTKEKDHSQDKYGLSDQYYKARSGELKNRLKNVENYDKDKEGDYANRMIPEQQKVVASGLGTGTDTVVQSVGAGMNALGKATDNKKLADTGMDIELAADPSDRVEKMHYNNKFAETLGGKLVEQIAQQVPSMAAGAAAGMLGLPSQAVSLAVMGAGAYGGKTFENTQKIAKDNLDKRASALQDDAMQARQAGDINKYNQIIQKYNDLVNPLNYEKNLRDEMYNLSGRDTLRANGAGAISGATEVATELIPFDKLIPGLSANTLPWQAQSLGDILEEGIEEFAGDFTDPLQDAVLNGKSVKDEYKQQMSSSDFWKNALKDAAMGSATAGLMAGGNIAEGVASGRIDPNKIKEYNQLTKEARNDKANMRRADALDKLASLGDTESKIKTGLNHDSYIATMYDKYMKDENGQLSNLALNSGVEAIKENARELNRKYITEYAAKELNLNEKDAKALAHLSNKAGVAVEVATHPLEIDGHEVDSKLNSNGAIQISPDAKSPVKELFVQELTNATEGTDSYKELSGALKSMYDDGEIEVDQSVWDKLDDERSKTAYLASKAFSDTKTLEQLAIQHRSLAKIVSDKITELTNGTSSELSNAKKVMDKVIAQTPEQAFNKSAEAYKEVNSNKLSYYTDENGVVHQVGRKNITPKLTSDVQEVVEPEPVETTPVETEPLKSNYDTGKVETIKDAKTEYSDDNGGLKIKRLSFAKKINNDIAGHYFMPTTESGDNRNGYQYFTISPEAKIYSTKSNGELVDGGFVFETTPQIDYAVDKLGKDETLKLMYLDKNDLIKYAQNINSDTNWNKYRTKEEIIDAIGGALAKQDGIDVLRSADDNSGIIVLNKQVLGKDYKPAVTKNIEQNQAAENVNQVNETEKQSTPVEQPKTVQTAQNVQNEQNIKETQNVENTAQKQAKQASETESKNETPTKQVSNALKSGSEEELKKAVNSASDYYDTGKLPKKDKQKILDNQTKLSQTVIKYAEGKGDIFNPDTTDETKKASKSEIKRNAEKATYQTISKEMLGMNSYEKAKTLGEDEFIRQTNGLEEIPLATRGLTREARAKYEASKQMITQHFADLSYVIKIAGDRINNTMNTVNAENSELSNDGYHISFDKESEIYRMYDSENHVVNDPDIMKKYRGTLDSLQSNYDTEQLAVSKQIGYANLAGTVLGLNNPLNGKVASPKTKRTAIEDIIQKWSDGILKKHPNFAKDGKFTGVKLTENDTKLIETISTTDDATIRTKAMSELAKSVADQAPLTLSERLDAYRYMCLLSSPVTAIRNTVGNFASRQMYNLSDMSGFLVESALKASGKVRYNTLDMQSDHDINLLNTTKKQGDAVLNEMYQAAVKSGDIKKYMQGINSDDAKAITNAFKKWKGTDGYNLSSADESLYNAFSEQFASHLKDAGYDASKGVIVDKDGNKVEDYSKLFSDAVKSFSEASNSLMSSSELVNSSQEQGNYGFSRRDRQEAKVWRKFNTDYHSGELGNKFVEMETDDALTNMLNAERRSNALGKKGPLRWYADAENYIMNESELIGDAGFTGRRVADNMARYIDAQGYSVDGYYSDSQIPRLKDSDGNFLEQSKAENIINDTYKRAITEAEETTFHDTDTFTKTLNQLRNANDVSKFVLDTVMPFTGTPIAIGRRIVEFSPIGLINSLTVNRKKLADGTIDGQTFVRRISQGMTGTGIALLGAYMFAQGMLRPKEDDKDDKESKFEQSNGVQDYSLIMPDGSSFSLDWAAPASTPLLLGAQVYYELQNANPNDKFGSLLKGTSKLVAPMLDASYMSGLYDTLQSAVGDSYDSDDSDPINRIAQTLAKDYARQLVPAVGGKIEKTIDPVARTTYSDNFFDGVARSMLSNMAVTNLVYKEVTGKDLLQPQVDVNGEEVKNNSYVYNPVTGKATDAKLAGRIFNNFVSPATYKPNNMKGVNSELERLYEKTGNEYLLPQNLYTPQNDKNMKFTPEERTEYNKKYLKGMREQVEKFINSPTYQNYTDDERAGILNNIQKMYYQETKKSYFDKIGVDSSKTLSTGSQDALAAKDIGIQPYKFFSYKATQPQKDENGDNISHTAAMAVRKDMELQGDYEKVIQAYKDGKIKSLNSVGLDNTVASWNTDKFEYNYDLMESNLYNPNSKQGKSQLESFNDSLESNQEIQDIIDRTGISGKSLYDVQNTQSDYYSDGTAIRNSKGVRMRQKAVDSGLWDEVQKAIADGTMTKEEAIKVTGISKTVFNYSDSKFNSELSKLDNETETETGKSYSSSKSSSKRKSSRSRRSGTRSSGTRSSGKSSSSSSSSNVKVSSMNAPDLSFKTGKTSSDIYADTVYKPDSALKAKKIYKRSSAKKYENPFTSSRYSKIRTIAGR